MSRRGARAAVAAALALALLAVPLRAPAQQAAPDAPAILVADRVALDGAGRLVAEGNVEVLQGATRLSAGRVVYDRAADRLSVEGPVRLTVDETAVLLADGADISPDLRAGLLRSARLVLSRQTQIAAAEARRIDGSTTRLDRVVASSCEVCAANPVPLWQIRARRVVRDEADLQIWFDDARIEIYGVPVFYLPRLRVPDPSVARARGVLAPTFSESSLLGPGVRVPYFLPFGDSRDLTLTPYLAERSRTLEFRYRQAFRRGRLQLDGAVARDDLVPDPRAYLFANAVTRLPGDVVAGGTLRLTSDDTFLRDYDYARSDRLASSAFLRRARPDAFVDAQVLRFESLRFDERNSTLPFLVSDISWDRRLRPPALGGLARVRFAAHAHARRSGQDAVGRDVARLAAEADWQRAGLLPGGVLVGARANLLGDVTAVSDDAAFPDPVSRLVPRAALEARWPWTRAGMPTEPGGGGRSQLLEPVAQLVWTGAEADAEDLPREESTQFELDAGNLFALSRFAAGDAIETGLRANLGLAYRVNDPRGWSLGAAAGRILRAEDTGQFDGIAALEGTRSDWLIGVGATLDSRLAFVGRALLDDRGAADSVETRVAWTGARFDLGGAFTALAASAAEARPDPITEIRLDGAWRIDARWRADADWVYDLETTRATEAELGLEYRANCLTVDVGLRRRFTTSNATEPATEVLLRIEPAGFGAARSGASPRSRACAR